MLDLRALSGRCHRGWLPRAVLPLVSVGTWFSLGGESMQKGESPMSALVGSGGTGAIWRRIPPWRCRWVIHWFPPTQFVLWVKALDPATRLDAGDVFDVVLPPWWRLSSETLLHVAYLRFGWCLAGLRLVVGGGGAVGDVFVRPTGVDGGV